jgi:hypothetical protein
LGVQSLNSKSNDYNSKLSPDAGVGSSLRLTNRDVLGGSKVSPNIDSVFQEVHNINMRRTSLNSTRGGVDSVKSSIDSDISMVSNVSNVSETRSARDNGGYGGINKLNSTQSNPMQRSMNSQEVDNIIRDIEKKSKAGLNASVSSSLNTNNLFNMQTNKFSNNNDHISSRGDFFVKGSNAMNDEQPSNTSDIPSTSVHNLHGSRGTTAHAAVQHHAQTGIRNPVINRTSNRSTNLNNTTNADNAKAHGDGPYYGGAEHIYHPEPEYVTKNDLQESLDALVDSGKVYFQESIDSLKYDVHKEMQLIIREQINQFEISREESKRQIDSLTQMLQQLLQANQSLREENESLRRIYK